MNIIENGFSVRRVEYREFRDYIIDKQIKTMLIVCICLLCYTTIAPVMLYLLIAESVWTNLLEEFGILTILVVIPLFLCLYIKNNEKIKAEDKKNLRGLLYDIVNVFLTISGELVFPLLSIYFSAKENRESGYLSFLLASLVIVSLFRYNPMTFLWIHFISTIVIMIASVRLDVSGTDTSGLYNLAIFSFLIIILYCTKYRSEKHSIQKTVQIAKMQKDREKFMVSLTHEMRTPLNAVLGKNQLILKDSTEEEIVKLSKEINSSGKVLLSLINDILDLAKLESGKMNIVLSEYNFSQISYEVSSIMRSEALGHGLEFIEDIPDDIPKTFIGDSVRIKQIIMNLISNAIKYTPKGSVTFRIRYIPEDDKKGTLRIEVEDTGIGIKPEDIPKLEGEYVRFDENKNQNIQGTGLGLSITSNLLSLMGSKLMVKSEYGKGSTFWFDLTQQIAQAKENAPAPEASEPFDASGCHVLVTDDNRVNFSVIKGLLKYFNVVPDYAPSGAECLEMLKEQTYDILFLDHMMPEMDGVETLQEITSKLPAARKHTAIIALTANFESNADEYYKELGFDGYLSKPVEMEKLNETLRKNITERK